MGAEEFMELLLAQRNGQPAFRALLEAMPDGRKASSAEG
jgi:hypothetical protein